MSVLTDNRAAMMPRVLAAIRDADSFLVTGHELVDGDSTGCEIALYHGLRSLGKDVRIVNNEALLARFEFLDPDGVCETYDEAAVARILSEVQAVIVVDNNSWARLAALEGPIRDSGLPVLCIDHHLAGEPFSELHLVDVSAAATGELVYDMLLALGATLDKATAQALYTSICTDTGWFRFSNTSRRTFEICAALLDHGLEPEVVHTAVHQHDTLALKRLVSRMWDKVVIAADGAFILSYVSQKMVQRAGVHMAETDGFIDELRGLKGALVVAMVKERKDGTAKLSIRSREPFCAHDVATELGGGGHRHASGATLAMPLEDATRRVREAVLAAIPGWWARAGRES